MNKLIITIITIIILASIVTKGFDYEGRTKEYNRFICAVNGNQEDCTTPSTPEQVKCDNYYDHGMCDKNGEVYPEYTKEALEMRKENK